MVTTEQQGKLTYRDPGVLAWLRMMRVYTEVDRRTGEFLKPFELSTAQFDVIAQVGSHEGMTQQQLAGVMMVTKGNITQLLDKLEERQMIERRNLPGKRGKCLYLTPKGWELNRRVVPQQEALIARLFSALNEDEQRTLGSILRRMDRSLTTSSESDAQYQPGVEGNHTT